MLGNIFADEKNNSIYLYGDIQSETVSSFIYTCTQVANKVEPINLFIHSYGGDAHACLGIIDFIKGCSVKINTFSYGVAMSAAALLLLSGTGVRSASKNTLIYLHDSESENKDFDYIFLNAALLNILKDSTTLSDKNIESIIKDGKFFTAYQAKKSGIIDKILWKYILIEI